jgi:cytochrome P450
VALFDPYSREFTANPYPTYRVLRERSPFYDASWGLTFFARHADVTGILRDKRFGRDIRHVVPPDQVDHRTYPEHLPNWTRIIRGSFIDLEPPEHTRIRGAFSRHFTKRRAEAERERVQARARALLEPLVGGEFDAIADYAWRLPVAVIADLIGVPPDEHAALLEWSHAIVRVFDLAVTPEEETAAEAAVIAFSDRLRGIIADRRKRPREDLISRLVAEDVLPEDDLVSSCILLLNAGHEATVHAIGNSLLALARNPVALSSLATNADLLPGAVEELLRYDPPLHMFERWVLEDLEWAGASLKTGDKVGLLFGAANHDPEVFDHPARLDLSRSDNPHVSFGLGTHFCLGAPLARIELEETLRAVAVLCRRLEHIDPEPSRVSSLVFRGLTELRLVTA